jgi:hypothetical protein
MLLAAAVCKPFDERVTPETSDAWQRRTSSTAALRPHVRQERSKRKMTAQTRVAGAKLPVARAIAFGRLLTTRQDLSLKKKPDLGTNPQG